MSSEMFLSFWNLNFFFFFFPWVCVCCPELPELWMLLGWSSKVGKHPKSILFIFSYISNSSCWLHVACQFAFKDWCTQYLICFKLFFQFFFPKWRQVCPFVVFVLLSLVELCACFWKGGEEWSWKLCKRSSASYPTLPPKHCLYLKQELSSECLLPCSAPSGTNPAYRCF